jgi:hypothetical protein
MLQYNQITVYLSKYVDFVSSDVQILLRNFTSIMFVQFNLTGNRLKYKSMNQ